MVHPFKGLKPLIIAIAATAVLSGCSSEEATDTKETIIRPVKLFTVDATNMISIRHFPAELKASDEANLAFRVGGKSPS